MVYTNIELNEEACIERDLFIDWCESERIFWELVRTCGRESVDKTFLSHKHGK